MMSFMAADALQPPSITPPTCQPAAPEPAKPAQFWGCLPPDAARPNRIVGHFWHAMPDLPRLRKLGGQHAVVNGLELGGMLSGLFHRARAPAQLAEHRAVFRDVAHLLVPGLDIASRRHQRVNARDKAFKRRPTAGREDRQAHLLRLVHND